MKKEILYCDTCGKEIGEVDEYLRDNTALANVGMANNKGWYQQWPQYDPGRAPYVSCGQCCISIFNAAKYGLVTYDADRIYEDAGYEVIKGKIK